MLREFRLYFCGSMKAVVTYRSALTLGVMRKGAATRTERYAGYAGGLRFRCSCAKYGISSPLRTETLGELFVPVGSYSINFWKSTTKHSPPYSGIYEPRWLSQHRAL